MEAYALRVKRIPLSKGLFAIVDDDKFDELNQFRWCAVESHGGYYALRNIKVDGKWGQQEFMHKRLLGIGKGVQGDHINGNKLDNRLENLRPCTQQQNGWNTRKPRMKQGKAPKSQYKGVFKVGRYWRAMIQHEGKRVCLGYYNHEDEAAWAYDMAASHWRGEFASLNYPWVTLPSLHPSETLENLENLE